MSFSIPSTKSAFHRPVKTQGCIRDIDTNPPFKENRIKRITAQLFDVFNHLHRENGLHRKRMQQLETEEKKYTWQQERKDDQKRFLNFDCSAMPIYSGRGSYGNIYYIMIEEPLARLSRIPEECVMKVSRQRVDEFCIQLPTCAKYVPPIEPVIQRPNFQHPSIQKDYEVTLPQVVKQEDLQNRYLPLFRTKAIVDVQNMNEGNYKEEKAFRILKANNIPFIPEYYGSFIKDGHHCILMEHVNHRNMKTILRSIDRENVTLCALVIFIKQLFVFARSLEDIGYSHCDLKPENLFFFRNKEGEWDLRVIDYNFVCKFRSDQVFEKPIQTFMYRAADNILGCPVGPSMDLWSFGCIVVEVYTGKQVFDHPKKKIKEDKKDHAFLLSRIIALKGKVPLKFLCSGIHTDTFYDIDDEGKVGDRKFRPFPRSKSILEQMKEEGLRRGDDLSLVEAIANFVNDYCISYERPSIRDAETIFRRTIEPLFKEQLLKESFVNRNIFDSL